MSWLEQSKKPIVAVYTDGSCLRNPGGAGGWAYVIVYPDSKLCRQSGHEKATTNNRMELTAALRALQSLTAGSNVHLFTDSKYVRNGILYWLEGWRKRGWLTSSKEPVVNQDLWEQLDAEDDRHMISWQWVRGHNGHQYNEMCDRLASKAARCNQLQEGLYE